MIVAVIALVVATTGGAVAGALITGASIRDGSVTGLDIKNNSIKGIDVRNGSLGTADLAPAAVASLRGQQGPAGPSTAFHYDSAFETLPWFNTTSQVVATLNLPAGNYVLFGKVLARNEETSTLVPEVFVNCSMTLGGATIDSSFDRGLAGGDRESFALSGRGTLAAAGSATIVCSSGPKGSFVDRHIEAIQVGSLS